MSTTEILLLIVAIGLFILSFILVDQGAKKKEAEFKPELTVEEIDQLKVQMQALMEDAISNSVIEAVDKMSQISNEKIMAVNDFSIQLLEKIELNNKEVVFLYDMLCKKEEEIRVTFSKMDTIRRENKEFLEKLTSLMNNRQKAGQQALQRTNTQMQIKESIDKPSDKDLVHVVSSDVPMDASKLSEDGIVFLDEAATKNKEEKKRAEIIKLHKQKKSVRDISRKLGIGQGEVKLIIDLYSQKN